MGKVSSAPNKLLSRPHESNTPNKLGNSIVVLSLNDTEMLVNPHKTNIQKQVARNSENKSTSVLPRLSKISSTCDNLTPIISNPRNNFLQNRRGEGYTSLKPNRQRLMPSKDKYEKGQKETASSHTASTAVTLV